MPTVLMEQPWRVDDDDIIIKPNNKATGENQNIIETCKIIETFKSKSAIFHVHNCHVAWAEEEACALEFQQIQDGIL